MIILLDKNVILRYLNPISILAIISSFNRQFLCLCIPSSQFTLQFSVLFFFHYSSLHEIMNYECVWLSYSPIWPSAQSVQFPYLFFPTLLTDDSAMENFAGNLCHWNNCYLDSKVRYKGILFLTWASFPFSNSYSWRSYCWLNILTNTETQFF